MRLISKLQGGRHPTLTSFFSPMYLALFLPAAILLYAVMPKKWKKYALLLESLGFFWLISGQYILWLLVSIVSVWGCGLWLGRLLEQRDAAVKAAEKPQRKVIKQQYLRRTRLVLALAALGNLGILLVLKYSGFFIRNVNVVFGMEISVPAYVMPIGISFYTLQAISYVFDVYQGTVKADRNLLRVALFLCFFPQIVEGPICRYGQTADQLWNAGQIRFDNLTQGLQRILFGLMKKLVVADRLNMFVAGVFGEYRCYEGGVIALAAVCYTIQLYMDFSGSMDAVTGTAQIFGVTMPENFKRPFFSRTISEFWTRWHVTLGTFFKDYIFYPVTMSKPMKKLTGSARKKLGNHFGPLVAGGIALFCVWFCNGVWHGAAWSFLFFGMYHFALILGGSLIAPAVKKLNEKIVFSPEKPFCHLIQVLRTCVLVVIGELFFRAEGLRAGMFMFVRMVTDFRFTSINGELLKALSIDGKDFLIVGVTVLIVFTVSLLNEKGICVRKALAEKSVPIRWAVLYALILYILIFGAYGVGYVPVDPMYANF